MLFVSVSSETAPLPRGSPGGVSTTTEIGRLTSVSPAGVHISHATAVVVGATSGSVMSPSQTPDVLNSSFVTSIRPSRSESTSVRKKLTTTFWAWTEPELFTVAVMVIGTFTGTSDVCVVPRKKSTVSSVSSGRGNVRPVIGTVTDSVFDATVIIG